MFAFQNANSWVFFRKNRKNYNYKSGGKGMASAPIKVTPEYKAAVTKFSDDHKNQRFLNDSIAHAELLATLMIGRAETEDEVAIYSGKLPSSCFGTGLSNTKSGNVRIIIDDKEAAVEEITKLKDNLKSRIHFKVLSNADGAHFFVAGDSFRLEIDHGNAKAVANFNDLDAVGILKSRFEQLWNESVDV